MQFNAHIFKNMNFFILRTRENNYIKILNFKLKNMYSWTVQKEKLKYDQIHDFH